MSLFYLDNEKRLQEIPLGANGDVLQMINGKPVFGPLKNMPPSVDPPFKLTVSAGEDMKIKAGTSVTLTAEAEKAESFTWKLIRSPASFPFTPIAVIVIRAPFHGHASIDGANVRPGTLIMLEGNFKSLWVDNLKGTITTPIIIQNKGAVVLGDPNWAGVGRNTALRFSNSHYFKILCTEHGAITVNGSTSVIKSPNGGPWKEHYRNIDLTYFTDNFEISGITSNNGGHGVVAKTDPDAKNQATYGSTLGWMTFKNMSFNNNQNEAMYIGHTATLWNIKLNQPEYPNPNLPNPNPTDFKAPMRYERIEIYNCKVQGSGLDGIQVAAVDNMIVSHTEVTNWAVQKNGVHQAGIMIGGQVRDSMVADNWVHDGWGEMLQGYGEGGNGTHVIMNNIFHHNMGDMVSIRGSKGALFIIKNNIITHSGPAGNLIRVNGTFNGNVKQAQITGNILAGPLNDGTGGVIYPKNFVYIENGPANMVEDIGNKKYNTVKEAQGIDLSVSEKTGPKPDVSVIPVTIKSPASASTAVEGFSTGQYVFEVTAKYGEQTAVDLVTVTVE